MIKTILMVSANPAGTTRLDLDGELNEIRAGLERSRDQSEFRLEYRPAVTWEEMRRALMAVKPEIVHFSGHGAQGKGLIFEGDDGPEVVTKESLKQLFELFPRVECVVLSACYSETEAKAIHKHVPCVVGMNYLVGDRSARKFAVGFYDGVMAGFGYQKAFKLGLSGVLDLSDMDTPVLLWRGEPDRESDEVEATIVDLESPTGRMAVESQFYIDRPMAEEDACREILRSGALIRIKGPREFGKSSLMARVVMKAEAAGAKTVSINFREIDSQSLALANLKDFLRFFCTIVTRKLKFENQFQRYCDSGLGEMMECAEYFEDYLLPQISSFLVLELDEVDVLLNEHLEKGWVVSFFSMLRAWYDSKMKGHLEWKKLRIVLVHSREVNRETLNQNQSPFNVGEEVALREFNIAQGVQLGRRHDVEPAITQELMELVGGHPQLLRQGLYAIARHQISLEQLRENGMTEAGLYGTHLEQMRERIEGDNALKVALRQVLAKGEAGMTIELKHKAKLRSFGLVVFQGNGVRIACELYRQYFLELWR